MNPLAATDHFVRRALQGVVRLWQRGPARVLPPACRFEPSCSRYAHTALENFSTPRALGLIVWRLLRCQPFGAGGYDPVPAADAKGGGKSLPSGNTTKKAHH